MITPNESITFRPRKLPADQSLPIPFCWSWGTAAGRWRRSASERVATFTGSLVVGRKALSEVEPGAIVAGAARPDGLVAAHPDSARAGQRAFELTDLSSTNGTIVDGEPVELVRRLRDGSVIFVGQPRRGLPDRDGG